ncbi:MAG: efflux RND transporter permease subunit, partial [Myxococcota bacterium]
MFIPTAFLGGIPGQLYRQFALTIAASTFFSALNALTLSPALCAIFLHPETKRRNSFARGFNTVFAGITRLYTAIVHFAIRLSPVTMLIYLGLVGVTVWAFLRIPKGFMPEMDQGYMFVVTQLPESASLTRTRAVVSELEKIFEQTPGVANTITVGGYSALDGTRPPNMATTFLVYKPWDERETPDAQQAAIVESLREKVSQIEEALVFPFVPPAIRGLGATGGFEFVLQDRGGVGLDFLGQLADEFVHDGNAQSGLAGLFTSFRAGTPQLFVDIDRTKVKTLGIPLTSVFDTLQTQLGSTYVNDLTLFNHTFQVTAQAEREFRAKPEDIGVLQVRAPDGGMVPLNTLATVRRSLGPRVISRYNMYPSATINGGPGPGYSSGQAIG